MKKEIIVRENTSETMQVTQLVDIFKYKKPKKRYTILNLLLDKKRKVHMLVGKLGLVMNIYNGSDYIGTLIKNQYMQNIICNVKVLGVRIICVYLFSFCVT